MRSYAVDMFNLIRSSSDASFCCKHCSHLCLCAARYDGLAIDVGRQKLYYTNAATNDDKVGELSTDGTGHRVLIRDRYSKPRGIVIDVNNR